MLLRWVSETVHVFKKDSPKELQSPDKSITKYGVPMEQGRQGEVNCPCLSSPPVFTLRWFWGCSEGELMAPDTRLGCRNSGKATNMSILFQGPLNLESTLQFTFLALHCDALEHFPVLGSLTYGYWNWAEREILLGSMVGMMLDRPHSSWVILPMQDASRT